MSAAGQVPASESEEQKQRRIEREDALLERWTKGGRLSEKEIAEIRHRLPDGSRLIDEASQLPAQNPLGRVRYAKDNLSDYETVFATKVRQIKNWIATGRAAEQPELPPLDAPHEMAAWWAKHMKQKVPAKLMLLASQKRSGSDGAATATTIDLTKLESAAGDALRQARAIRMAAETHLSQAYASGKDEQIEIHQRRWIRAVEQERKLEGAAREDAKATGALIPKAELLPELSAYLEVGKQMKRSARRRICAKFQFDLSPALLEALGAEIEKELARGDAVLRQLKSFRDLDEIDTFELTQPAPAKP